MSGKNQNQHNSRQQHHHDNGHSNNANHNPTGRKKKNCKISQHFSYGDFACKCDKCDGEVKTSLGLIGGLEMLRAKLNARINIVHAYECENARRVNKGKNYHAQGLAADIQVENKSLQEVFLAAEQIPEFRGIGLDCVEKCLHVDTRKDEEIKRWVIDHGKVVFLVADNRDQYLSI